MSSSLSGEVSLPFSGFAPYRLQAPAEIALYR